MRLYRMIEKLITAVLDCLWVWFIYIHEVKNIFSKRKIFKMSQLTDAQKREIDLFYQENYGKRVPYWWHRLYMSYTGVFNSKFLPEIIYTTQLEPKRNERLRTLPFEDKAMIACLFGGEENLYIPQIFLMRIEGQYYDAKNNPIDDKTAIQIAAEIQGDVVIKVSRDSSSGRGVKMLTLQNGIDQRTGKSAEAVFSEMGKNFVLQERIYNHPDIAKLYKHSINTLRVMTYQTKQAIRTTPVIMRMGRGSGEVDNAHAGGIFIGIDAAGRLRECAFSEYHEKYEKHPDTGVIFKGYEIPRVTEICEIAKRLHKRILPYQFASWDFAVDTQGRIALIEVNLHSQAVWVQQMANGEPVFGDDTAEILHTIRKNL